MISTLSIVFMAISSLISIGLPIALVIWVMKKYRPGFKPIAIGMLVFFVVQMVVRIPIIQILSLSEDVQFFTANNFIVYVLILSVTAGLFEEGGRLLGFRLFLKKRREYKHGIAYGVGHGGIEAILLVGLSFIANIIFSVIINQGMLNSASDTIVLPSALIGQLQAASEN